MKYNSSTNLILPLGMLVLTYFAGTRILETMGILQSAQGAANQQAGASGNPFSPTFWSAYKGQKYLISTPVADSYAEQIYDSVHAYWFNEPAVFTGIIQGLKTKSQVSYLCYRFQILYGVGLLPYLQQYLTEAQIAQGVMYANSLPNYLP